jgi:hypothetical protein
VARYYSAAAAFNLGTFSVMADARGDFPGENAITAYSGGAEYLAGDTIPIRGGYTYETTTGNQYLGLGLGFIAEGVGVDLAYRHALAGGTGQFLALTIKMQTQ